MEAVKISSVDENIYMDICESCATEPNSEYLQPVNCNRRKSDLTVIDSSVEITSASCAITMNVSDIDGRRESSNRQAETKTGNKVMSLNRCNQLLSVLWKVALVVVGIGSLFSVIFISFQDGKDNIAVNNSIWQTSSLDYTTILLENFTASKIMDELVKFYTEVDDSRISKVKQTTTHPNNGSETRKSTCNLPQILEKLVPVQSKAVSRTTKSRVTKFIMANWAANPNPSPAVEDSIDYKVMSEATFKVFHSTITHREDASQFFSSGGYIWETSLKSNLVIAYKHQHGKEEHIVLTNEININSTATVITSLIFKHGSYLIVSFKERGLYLVDLKGNIMQVVTNERICSIASEIIGHERLFAMKYNSNILYSFKLVNGCWKFQKSIEFHKFTPSPQIYNHMIMNKGIIRIYNAVRNQIIWYNCRNAHISIQKIKAKVNKPFMANTKQSTVNHTILIDVDKSGYSIMLNRRYFQLHILEKEREKGYIRIPKKSIGDEILSVAALPHASIALAPGLKVDYEVWIWVLVKDVKRVKSYFITEDTLMGGIMKSLFGS